GNQPARRAPRDDHGRRDRDDEEPEGDEDPALAGTVRTNAIPTLRDDVVVHGVLDLRQLGAELVLEIGELDLRPRAEERVHQGRLVGKQRTLAGDLRRGELVVAVEVGDREPTAHGEVDDRGGDVDEVRMLVDEGADLSGQHAVRRYELDGPLNVTVARSIGTGHWFPIASQ